MIDAIYIEKAAWDHPRVEAIRRRFSHIKPVVCERYGEVFNRSGQNFRVQKQRPALILARKHDHFVLPAPASYGIGGEHNYYFSHMLNCLYDCRYCFLQGMYRSANYVLFVNYEDFADAIDSQVRQCSSGDVYFYSGYDCDSLALEPVSGFVEQMLPVFETRERAWLELRTKSTQIRGLLNRPPVDRCVVAFSLSPQPVVQRWEARTPSLEKRLQAIESLQTQGWSIGLRFDPIVAVADYRQHYNQMFEQVFAVVNQERLHSVSLGTFRLPQGFYQRMVELYPYEPLLVAGLERQETMVGYRLELEQEMMAFCREQLLHYIPEEKFFPCV